LGELHLDQPADGLRVDVELVGVHRHAAFLAVGDRGRPPVYSRKTRCATTRSGTGAVLDCSEKSFWDRYSRRKPYAAERAAGFASWEAGRVNRHDRDRDTEGRARQARPRDALGRPLPYGAQGVEPVSEEPLPPEGTLMAARELVEVGRPFAAHEVLEARWKAGPVEERDLWQGLAQLCVAITHAARGNQTGADRLFERAAERLATYAATGRRAYGLDLDAVVEQARRHTGTF
jgi:hypothetical protein